MPENTDLSIPLPAVVDFPHQKQVMSLDRCIIEWLDEMYNHGESKKTLAAYKDTVTDFREHLQRVGLDLGSDAAVVGPLARQWCNHSKREGVGEVAPSTFNQRRSILSSFYEYAILNEVLTINPTKRFKTRKVLKKNAAHPIQAEDVAAAMRSIDASTPEGLRDKAILAIALTTARRVSEIAQLRLCHVTRMGTKAHLFFERCKGNESAENLLDEKTSAVLFQYLEAVYGSKEDQARLKFAFPDTPLWICFSNNPKYRGKMIGPRALERICDKYLKTSKFHALRHTSAVRMHKRGATLAEIGKALNHKNLKTTSDYMDEHLGYENAYADHLAEDFGL